MSGLGFADRGGQPARGDRPGYETPEQFRARKRREALAQERARRAREDAERRRDPDPYDEVTTTDGDPRRPRWRRSYPGVAPRVFDETVRTLDRVPGPHRAITGPYQGASNVAQGRMPDRMPGSRGGPSGSAQGVMSEEERLRKKLERRKAEYEREKRKLQDNPEARKKYNDYQREYQRKWRARQAAEKDRKRREAYAKGQGEKWRYNKGTADRQPTKEQEEALWRRAQENERRAQGDAEKMRISQGRQQVAILRRDAQRAAERIRSARTPTERAAAQRDFDNINRQLHALERQGIW